MTKQPRKNQLQSFHVEKAQEGAYCGSYVACASVMNRNWIRNWHCGESAAFVIRRNGQSWGNTYCKLHAVPHIAELQAEMLAKPEEEEESKAS